VNRHPFRYSVVGRSRLRGPAALDGQSHGEKYPPKLAWEQAAIGLDALIPAVGLWIGLVREIEAVVPGSR